MAITSSAQEVRADAKRGDADKPAASMTFIVLTFAVTWTLWALVLRIAHAGANTSPSSAWLSLGGPVFLLGVFAPGLVAVALTAREAGREGVNSLLRRIGRWQVGARYFAFVLLLMPMVKLTVAILVRMLTGAWPAFGETRPTVLLGATLVGTIGQAGEEVGWRGYLLPRLAARTSLAMASVIVGVIWSLWHLPLFYATGTDTNHQSFPLYTLQVVAISVVLAWLYWRTGGSLLLTMMMHSAFNNMKDIVPSAGSPSASPFTLDSTLVFRFSVLVLWSVAAVLLVQMRGARLVTGPLNRDDTAAT